MVAIFTGLGAGFERGSGSVLGGAGLLGSGSLGRNKEQVLLNAATGNLMISQQDEFLVGLGPDSTIGRTYNSIESVSDGDNGDHWRQSTTRAVHGLTGTLNTAGSTIKRTSGDGSDITYSWNAAISAYVATDGAGAHDKLVNASGVWTWTDGNTRSTETYSAYGTDNWRITQAANAIGVALTFTYTGANLTQVTTQDGSYEQYSWSGSNITQIVTGYTDLVTSTAKTLTRTRYGYDTSNRLTSVTIDLTPEDNSVSDGATYVTTYTYDGTSTRVASISETDGSSLAIHYDSSGRVDSLTQTVTGAATRVTGIAYGAGSTTITDSLNQVTTLEYNADGSLKKITSPPAYSGAAPQVVQFGYSVEDGVVLSITVLDALGIASSSTYDSSGNLMFSEDGLGNTVSRTYGSLNEMLTETRSGSDAGSAGANHTTRYTYNGNTLSSKIDAEGRVTVYQYATINGVLTDKILMEKQYNDAFYDVSGLTPTDVITTAQVSSFLGSMATKVNTVTTNYQYDLRGNVSSIRTTSSANSAGGGDTTQPYALTSYVYDQAGQLVKRTASGFNPETFVYDGMGRIKASTDLNGGTTSIAFYDSTMTTVVTLASGLTQTSVYNKAGELVSFGESGSNVTGGTAYYEYDKRGQLRIATDATGHKSYIVYDKTGRKIADVDHYGNLIEYKYDADDRLVATVRYTNDVASQLANLANVDFNMEMSTLRPTATSTDLWTWNVYDADSRVIETIDGAGDVTTYQYDASSRLIGTIRYATKLTPTQISNIKTTLPTSAVLPAADSAHDSVARNFYDKTGLLIGVLDGEGYLTSFTYDNVGRKIAQTAFATATTSGLRASGTFAALITSLASTSDRTTRYVYDGQSHLRFQIDALNHVTEYIYDSGIAEQASVLRETIQYAGTISALSDYKLATVKTAVAALAGDTSNRKSWAVYDTAGRLAYSINAIGAVTGYSYDTLGNLIKTVQFATLRATTTLPDLATMTSWQTANANTSATGDRITRNYYSARGELRYTVDAEGYVTRIDYDAEGRATTNVRWDTAIVTTDSTTIANVATLATGASTTTSTTYDNDGRVDTTTDGELVVTKYAYNHNGTLDSVYQAYGTADQVQTKFDYDNAGRKTTQYDAYGTTEQTTTSSAYDGLGNALTSTDPNGAVTTYDHDHLGRVITRTDALTTGVVHYQYNGFGEAVKVTDARTNVSYNYYNNDGTLAYTIAPLGEVTEYRYDAFGELSDTIRYASRISLSGLTGGAASSIAAAVTALANSALDSKTHLAFNANGTVSAKTDALNAVTNFGYDAFGDVTSETDPLNTGTTIQTTRIYDRRGLLKTQVVDSAGGGKAITTNYNLYDAFGRVLTLTDPENHATTKTYYRDGRVSSSTDALNHTTNYYYDKRGNLAAVQAPPPNTGDPRPVTRYAYDKLDRLVYTVDALGDVTQNSYDNDGHVILSRAYATPISLGSLPIVASVSAIALLVGSTSGDEITHSVYDADGQLRYSIDARNFLTEYDYDVAGNAIRSVAYSAAVTLSTYTIASVQAQITAMSPAAIAASPITRNVYNADGQRSYTIDALGYVTAYTYDALGNVIKQQRVAAPYTPTGDPTDAQMATWLTSNSNATNDRTSRAIYDQNGQLRFSVDAETYVTQYTYNADGSVLSTIRYADKFDGHTTGSSTFTAFANGTTLAQAISYVAVTPTKPAATTQFIYDSAGRLTETVDPMNVRTVMVLNQLGQATRTTVAYGTADASVTDQSYDELGRVHTVTRAFGQSEVTTTTYGYDALGNLLTVQDGRNNTTTRTYDALGNVLSVTVPLDTGVNAVTYNSYDAFGNLVKVIDPRNNTGYFYYDLRNQLSRQIDPEGYETKTTYTFTGKTDTVTRYVTHATWTGTPSATNLPNVTAADAAHDAVSSFGYDLLDRVTSTTQTTDANSANNIKESYGYNAFGDRTSVTNKLQTASVNGTTTNTFDKRGLLLSETLPVYATGTTYIANVYTYDARGNRLTMVEASGVSGQQRTTTYTYDLADRLTLTTHDAVTIVSGDLSTTTTNYVPTEGLSYDLRGNVIKSVDANGAATWTYYDHLDRKIAQVSPLGMLTGWTYDANGNVHTATVYGDLLTTLPTTGGGTPPSPVNAANYRTTTYEYDKNNRLISTTGAAIKMGSFDGTNYVITTDAAASLVAYDAAGNVTLQTDARGGKVWSYYNALGQMTAQVDQENYLTVWVRDANGNATSETRYATRIDPAAHTVAASTSVVTLQGWAGTDATNDRTTTFTYDAAARRLTETRLNVITLTSTSGTPTTSSQSSQIVYAYNGLGEVLSKQEANGDITTYTYDGIGRTLTEIDPQHADQTGPTNMVSKRTTYAYDGLNNVVKITVDDAFGHSGGASEVTFNTYGAGGRLLTSTRGYGQPEATTHTYSYDAAGNTIGDAYTRTPGSGSAFSEVINYRYDAAGRLVYQTVAHKAIGASTWIFDADTNQVSYNAYGDVAAKGMNGQWQETFDYDANGHAWRSNTGDGSTRIFLYDKNGNATLTIASSGTVNLATYTLDAALNLVTNTNAWTAGSHAVTGAIVTIEVFDKRNQDVESREPFREINPNISNPAVFDTALVSHQRGYNAFGEVAWQLDARYTQQSTAIRDAEKTLYTYNTMGRVIQKQSPTVSVTAENGGINSAARPTENDYYDISGRLLAVSDANGHVTRRTLLAGTGHGDDAALVTVATHADSYSVQTTYDVFGNARTIGDEYGNTGTHLETRTYDSLNQLKSVAHRAGLLTDYYAYDELGQRTQHWNSQFGSGVKDLTNYDGQGRITLQVTSSGSADAVTTGTSYVWTANSGAGYWTKTTVNTAGLPASENDDYFGRVLTRTDYGLHVFNYTFDYAGHLTGQTSSAGENIVYTYYNSGRIAKMVTGTNDGWSGESATSQYSYDVDGNRIRESHAVTGNWYDYYNDISYNYTTSYQDATVTWDAMNRMVSFTDTGASGSAPASIAYEYDAVGNVRHMAASYRAIDAQGNVGTTATNQDYWYLYDSMDRFTTTMGTFTGTRGTTGAITRGATGLNITYDNAGRRSTVTGTTTMNWSGFRAHMKGDTGYYWYTDDMDSGDDTTIYTAATATYQGGYQDTYTYRDDGQLMGVTSATEGAVSGGQTITAGPMGSPVTTGTYTRDALGRTTSYSSPGYSATSLTYDYLNELTSQTTSTVRGSDTFVSTTTNNYRAETYAGSGMWTGTYQGGSVVHSRTTTTKNSVSQPTTDTKTTLTWWDGAETSHVTFTPDLSSPGTTNNSSYYYDDAGHLQSVYIQDGRSRTVSFVNNAEGQVLSRDEADSLGTGDPRELHYYFNGQRLGDISNNGTSNVDYVTANAQRVATPGTGPFANGSANSSPYADFDQSYDPINGLNYGQASSRYTVNTGDTLTSIASALWGDQSLWYLLASANGLTGSETLPAGMSLIVPNNVQNTHNSSSTFRPYNPVEAAGDLSPTAAAPPKKAKNCGVLGMILMVVIAVAVAAIAGPAIIGAPAVFGADGALVTAATGLTAVLGGTAAAAGSIAAIGAAVIGGAIAGAAGSIVSQGFGVATGIQDKFSWKGVALGALSGAVGGGVGSVFGKSVLLGSHLVTDVAKGVVTNVATQGIAVATKLQPKFDWASVAVAGAVSGAVGVANRTLAANHIGTESSQISRATPRDFGFYANQALSGAAGSIAGAAMRSIINGSNFGDNIVATLPDVIGATIGNLVADNVASIGGACFIAGTLIHTVHGLVPIEEIKVGDWVFARDDQGNDTQIHRRKVIELFKYDHRSTREIIVSDARGATESFIATNEHPFFVPEKGWTPARKLELGDTLCLIDGSTAEVISSDPGKGLNTVYNFSVDQDHSYFIGKNGVWVHNQYSPDDDIVVTAKKMTYLEKVEYDYYHPYDAINRYATYGYNKAGEFTDAYIKPAARFAEKVIISSNIVARGADYLGYHKTAALMRGMEGGALEWAGETVNSLSHLPGSLVLGATGLAAYAERNGGRATLHMVIDAIDPVNSDRPLYLADKAVAKYNSISADINSGDPVRIERGAAEGTKVGLNVISAVVPILDEAKALSLGGDLLNAGREISAAGGIAGDAAPAMDGLRAVARNEDVVSAGRAVNEASSAGRAANEVSSAARVPVQVAEDVRAVANGGQSASAVRASETRLQSPVAAGGAAATEVAEIGVPVTRATNPLSPVLEFDAHGNEIFYRAMKDSHYRTLAESGELVGTGETSLAPLEAYSTKFKGTLVRLTTKPGTSAQLQEIGIAANGPAAAEFPGMSTRTGPWNKTNARFKVEGLDNPRINDGFGVMNTQLGKGTALDIFNRNLVGFKRLR